jgi:hypothetical protein
MERDRLKALVAELDREIQDEGALVMFTIPDDRYSFACEVVANESGYLRLGVELLKAGLTGGDLRPSSKPVPLPIVVEHLLHPESDVRFVSFEIRDDF